MIFCRSLFSAHIHSQTLFYSNFYLRKWLKDPFLDCTDFRDVVDWDYYKMRLGRSIQKIITVPAGMQQIGNPCPRVQHPLWLQRSLEERSSGRRQVTITSLFKPKLMSACAGANLGAAVSNARDSGDISADNSLKRSLHLQDAALSPLVGDVEDLMTPSSNGKGRSAVIIHQRKSMGTPTPASTGVHEPTISPSMVPVLPSVFANENILAGTEVTTDLSVWLEHRKHLWKQRRTEKQALAFARSSTNFGLDPNFGSNPTAKRAMGVADLIQNANMQASFAVWQIIELQETDVPGEFTAWAMTNRTQLQKLTLVVPRILYVNYKEGASEEPALLLGGKKVTKHLPHERNCLNLYEINVSEKKFVENEKAISLFLSDPSIEGVYESQVPLWFRATVRLGCLARVSRKASNKNGKAYHLTDLDFISTVGQPYLALGSAVFRKIYIYHTIDRSSSSGLGVVAMFVVEGNTEDEERRKSEEGSLYHKSKAYVWLANGSGSQESKPPLHRIFRRHEPDERAEVKFITSMTTSVEDALRLCQERLGAYQRERRGPTIVVVQGSCGSEHRSWRRAIPILQEFPIAAMPPNSTDDKYPAPIYWQNFVAERLVQRYRHFNDWLEDRLHSARFAHVPVANLGIDAITTMTDVLVARRLESGRHLLWASENQLPDLGGAEQDFYSVWSDPLSEPILNVPGAYRSISVEIDVFGLAVSAIMASSSLDGIGGAVLSDALGETLFGDGVACKKDVVNDVSKSLLVGDNTAAADASCARAFLVLKAMVSEWIHMVSVDQGSNSLADASLIHLYRYLCDFGGNSLMNDPALHRIVYGLMSKLFKRLVHELRSLGADIVFANFHTLIIHTKKHTLDAAEEYIEFLTATVKAKEIFNHLHLGTKRVWEELLWLERENWGGLEMRSESPSAQRLAIENAELPEQGGGSIEPDGEAEVIVPFLDVEAPNMPTQNDSGVGPEDAERVSQYTRLQRKKLAKDPLAFINDDFDDEEDEDWEGNADNVPSNFDRLDTQIEEDDEVHNNDGHGDGQHVEWNLATYLPPAAAKYFHFFATEFMRQHRNKWSELCSLRAETEAEMDGGCSSAEQEQVI